MEYIIKWWDISADIVKRVTYDDPVVAVQKFAVEVYKVTNTCTMFISKNTVAPPGDYSFALIAAKEDADPYITFFKETSLESMKNKVQHFKQDNSSKHLGYTRITVIDMHSADCVLAEEII